MNITWHGITLAQDEDGVYRPHENPIPFPISLEEGEECWLAAVGGGQRRHEGATPEEALNLAAEITLAKAGAESFKWAELEQKIREVVG